MHIKPEKSLKKMVLDTQKQSQKQLLGSHTFSNRLFTGSEQEVPLRDGFLPWYWQYGQLFWESCYGALDWDLWAGGLHNSWQHGLQSWGDKCDSHWYLCHFGNPGRAEQQPKLPVWS